MRTIKIYIGLLLLLSAGLVFVACGRKGTSALTEENKVVIGVCAYNTDFAEMQLFINYYRDYIAQGMPVEFLFSESLNSGEEERTFIRAAKEQGAEGIISFYGQDIKDTLKLCEEEEIYYVLGSGTISNEDFEDAKENPYFLGVIGPNTAAEYQAGYDMVASFIEKGANTYLLLTGGAPLQNSMHLYRAEGMLDALSHLKGVRYQMPIEEISTLSEVTVLESGQEHIKVVVCPGYFSTGEGSANLTEALEMQDYDAVASVMGFGSSLEEIMAANQDWGHTTFTGTVDCFSEENLRAMQKKDAYGESELNYVAGKYASIAGPAVAAVYNAVSGYPEVVRDKEAAFRLSQEFWKAETLEAYEELYGFTQGVYENAYSCDELMQVIAVFSPEATYEDFAALTRASDVKSVRERIQRR
jgi:hypothetical protein